MQNQLPQPQSTCNTRKGLTMPLQRFFYRLAFLIARCAVESAPHPPCPAPAPPPAPARRMKPCRAQGSTPRGRGKLGQAR